MAVVGPSPITGHVTEGAANPVRHRLALGLTPSTEAEFVALVDMARPLLAEGVPAELVVPALDQGFARRRVANLVGVDSVVVVEPAHEYLRRGHDRVALVGDDPIGRGRSLAAALAWLHSLLDGPVPEPGEGPDTDPGPGQVVAWLGDGRVASRPPAADVVDRVGSLPVVPLENGRLLVRTAWGGTLLAFTSDRSLTPDLVLDGAYDPAFVRFLERHLRVGGVAVDVGANVGLFSVRMAQLVGPSGSVLALEADPEVHGVLQENLDMNYVSGWAQALAVAAFSSIGQLTFHRTTRFRGIGSLLENGASGAGGYTSETYSTITVDAVLLDDLLSDMGDVDLVKIDVEGAERHVLEGISRTIGQGRVRTLAIEFVRAVLGAEWDPLCALLATYRDRYGASFATVAPDGSRVHRELEEAVRIGAFPQLLVDFGADRHG